VQHIHQQICFSSQCYTVLQLDSVIINMPVSMTKLIGYNYYNYKQIGYDRCQVATETVWLCF